MATFVYETTFENPAGWFDAEVEVHYDIDGPDPAVGIFGCAISINEAWVRVGETRFPLTIDGHAHIEEKIQEALDAEKIAQWAEYQGMRYDLG